MKGCREGIITILTIAMVCIAIGCATGISREALLEKMKADPALLIVDVRSQGEYDHDHLPGAVHVPFYTVGTGIEQLGYPKTGPVAVYCEHGPRAGLAGMALYLHGFDQIYSLKGHMKAWRANGFPIEITTHDTTGP